MKRKTMKRKTKRLIAFITIVLVGISIFVVYKVIQYQNALISGGTTDAGKFLSKDDNTLDFDIGDHRYVHFIAKISKGVPYKIVNANNEIEEEGISTGEIDYFKDFGDFGECDNGTWKFIVDIDEDRSIDYTLWIGNDTSYDRGCLSTTEKINNK